MAGTINPRSAKSVHCETCAEGEPDVDAGERGGRREGGSSGSSRGWRSRSKGPVHREMPPTELAGAQTWGSQAGLCV